MCPGLLTPTHSLAFPAGLDPGHRTQSLPSAGHERGWGSTCVECCRMASSLSWIRRSSSIPMLRQSARRRRREEAKSRQRSRVSSAGAIKGLLPSPIPSTSSSSQNLQSIHQVPSMALNAHFHGIHMPGAGCRPASKDRSGAHLSHWPLQHAL
jgi:hypothetical protein